MKTFLCYIRTRAWVLALAGVFLLIRLPLLDQLFLLLDERDIALTSYALAHTGADLRGIVFPASFEGISPNPPFVTVYLMAVWWLLGIPLTVYTTRLFFVLCATSVVILVYEVVLRITRHKWLAMVTTIVFCFSPWVYHITRLGLEINIAFPFLLVGVLFHMRKQYGIAYLGYIAAFFSYQGIRPTIVVVLVYIELFLALVGSGWQRYSLYRLGMHMLLVVVLVGISLGIEKNMLTHRYDEVVFLGSSRIADEVDYKRYIGNQSLAPINKLLYNKPTVIYSHMIERFLNGLDMSYLFVTGDYEPIYNNNITGQFFFPLVLFYVLGFLYLGRNPRKRYIAMVGMAVIGLVSSIINVFSLTFAIRSLLSGVGIAFIIALGLYGAHQRALSLMIRPRYSIYGVGVLVGICLVGHFLYSYMTLRPALISHLYNEDHRILAHYLEKLPSKQHTLHVPLPYHMLLSYAFFTLPDGSEWFDELGKTLVSSDDVLHYRHKSFMHCSDKAITASAISGVIFHVDCIDTRIVGLIDEGVIPADVLYYTDIPFGNYGKRPVYYSIHELSLQRQRELENSNVFMIE